MKSPANQFAANRHVAKVVVILTQDDAYDNNKIIKDDIEERLSGNSMFKKTGGPLNIHIKAISTEENYGLYPITATWVDTNENICFEAEYPVDFSRCYGGRSFCAYINKMETTTSIANSSKCSDNNYNLAIVDASILNNSLIDVFDVVDTYKDEAYRRLSR